MPLRMIRCEAKLVMFSPSNHTEPLLARGLPHTVISRVVLPAPLAPISETISPWLTLRLTSLSARMAP